MAGLYLDTLITGHKSCSKLCILNEQTLQNFKTNVFLDKKNKDNSKTKKQSGALPPPSNKHIKKLSLKYFILTFHYQAIF